MKQNDSDLHFMYTSTLTHVRGCLVALTRVGVGVVVLIHVGEYVVALTHFASRLETGGGPETVSGSVGGGDHCQHSHRPNEWQECKAFGEFIK